MPDVRNGVRRRAPRPAARGGHDPDPRRRAVPLHALRRVPRGRGRSLRHLRNGDRGGANPRHRPQRKGRVEGLPHAMAEGGDRGSSGRPSGSRRAEDARGRAPRHREVDRRGTDPRARMGQQGPRPRAARACIGSRRVFRARGPDQPRSRCGLSPRGNQRPGAHRRPLDPSGSLGSARRARAPRARTPQRANEDRERGPGQGGDGPPAFGPRPRPRTRAEASSAHRTQPDSPPDPSRGGHRDPARHRVLQPAPRNGRRDARRVADQGRAPPPPRAQGGGRRLLPTRRGPRGRRARIRPRRAFGPPNARAGPARPCTRGHAVGPDERTRERSYKWTPRADERPCERPHERNGSDKRADVGARPRGGTARPQAPRSPAGRDRRMG